MDKRGALIIIDDDEDDLHILRCVLEELGFQNEVRYFSDGRSAHEYLSKSGTEPFLIICDIGLPRMDGFESKELILSIDGFSEMCVPFVFMSTTGVAHKASWKSLSPCGFFVKETSYEGVCELMRKILDYWGAVYAPVPAQV